MTEALEIALTLTYRWCHFRFSDLRWSQSKMLQNSQFWRRLSSRTWPDEYFRLREIKSSSENFNRKVPNRASDVWWELSDSDLWVFVLGAIFWLHFPVKMVVRSVLKVCPRVALSGNRLWISSWARVANLRLLRLQVSRQNNCLIGNSRSQYFLRWMGRKREPSFETTDVNKMADLLHGNGYQLSASVYVLIFPFPFTIFSSNASPLFFLLFLSFLFQ